MGVDKDDMDHRQLHDNLTRVIREEIGAVRREHSEFRDEVKQSQRDRDQKNDAHKVAMWGMVNGIKGDVAAVSQRLAHMEGSRAAEERSGPSKLTATLVWIIVGLLVIVAALLKVPLPGLSS